MSLVNSWFFHSTIWWLVILTPVSAKQLARGSKQTLYMRTRADCTKLNKAYKLLDTLAYQTWKWGSHNRFQDMGPFSSPDPTPDKSNRPMSWNFLPWSTWVLGYVQGCGWVAFDSVAWGKQMTWFRVQMSQLVEYASHDGFYHQIGDSEVYG